MEREKERERRERTRRKRGEGRVLPSVDLCVVAWSTWRLALRKVRRADRRGGLEGSAGILVKADSSSLVCSQSRALSLDRFSCPFLCLFLALTSFYVYQGNRVSDPYFLSRGIS